MKDDTADQAETNARSQAGGIAPESPAAPSLEAKKQAFLCDRCGFEMFETNCKIICPNCGSRYDCSDLSIYFD
ncbi:MAG TPA: hypothetical protein VF784_13200 [Anaerolineales bacterium]